MALETQTTQKAMPAHLNLWHFRDQAPTNKKGNLNLATHIKHRLPLRG